MKIVLFCFLVLFLLVGCWTEQQQEIFIVDKNQFFWNVIETEKIDYFLLEDESIQKFVSKGMPFTDVQYEPEDLLPLTSTQSLHVQGEKMLRKEASERLDQLSLAFYEVFKKPIVVMSAYRSYQYQKNQISESCKQSGYCAKEGESEHQLGLAVDVREVSNEEKFLSNYQEYYDWLKDNAHHYGFHQSYQKGKEIDGYPVEPWHWRYVGVELATELWESGMTLSEKVLDSRTKIKDKSWKLKA